jgi:AmiR/NasT family two-component response regulator
MTWIMRRIRLGKLMAQAAEDRATIDNLRRALQTNREIGMAIGILMATHRILDAEAFDLLRTASQHTHRKLAQIASDVVHTGSLDYPIKPAQSG